jgi:hypothetical protein
MVRCNVIGGQWSPRMEKVKNLRKGHRRDKLKPKKEHRRWGGGGGGGAKARTHKKRNGQHVNKSSTSVWRQEESPNEEGKENKNTKQKIESVSRKMCGPHRLPLKPFFFVHIFFLCGCPNLKSCWAYPWASHDCQSCQNLCVLGSRISYIEDSKRSCSLSSRHVCRHVESFCLVNMSLDMYFDLSQSCYRLNMYYNMLFEICWESGFLKPSFKSSHPNLGFYSLVAQI